jgi:hypothetical protein
MPESVSKGPILKRLDEASTNQNLMQQLLDALEVDGENSDIAAILDAKGLLTPDEKTHIQNDWFSNWWPNAQPVQPILARGFIVALETAIEKGVPLDCYWVCSTGHHEMEHHESPHGSDGAIEVNVLWNDCHVTVLIHTPGGGMNSIQDAPLTVAEPIKVIARDANGSIGVFQPMARDDSMATAGSGSGHSH